MSDKTLQYYNANAKSFTANTFFVDFSQIQQEFLITLPPGAYILDFGCGSGRDTKYFLEHGYKVDAIDGSLELCKLASAHTGIKVRQIPVKYEPNEKMNREYCGKNPDTKARYHQLQRNMVEFLRDNN